MIQKSIHSKIPAGMYLFKVSDGNARAMCEFNITVEPSQLRFSAFNRLFQVTKTEVKGRITVDKLEEERKKDEAHKENEIRQFNTVHDSASQSAFEMFVQSMKDAGQLPEKPSPVVSSSTVSL